MKQLFTILLVTTMLIFGCKNKEKGIGDHNKPDKPKIDTLKFLPDVELVNPEKDAQVASMKRRRPEPPPPPPDVPPTQPAPQFCIFYDFDGHTISGTMWNVNGIFSVGGSGLNAIQQKQIVDSGRSYYKPITGVYVTDDSTIFLKYDATKRIRVVYTVDNEWYGTGAGGVAYINSANWGDGSPAFVFTKLLGYSARNSGDAGAHEAGHTLGLRHQSTWQDGVKISDYNWGNGQEAPIMGASYNAIQPKWIIGLNSIGVMQNDTLIMNTTVRK